jgi:hypothetical protein
MVTSLKLTIIYGANHHPLHPSPRTGYWIHLSTYNDLCSSDSLHQNITEINKNDYLITWDYFSN